MPQGMFRIAGEGAMTRTFNAGQTIGQVIGTRPAGTTFKVNGQDATSDTPLYDGVVVDVVPGYKNGR